ncbi:hypothetical protein B0A50_08394 [Salinomyces thailandicus]|uniref:Uncharacterized protein n=1 Tax=Salinomyces thailandicus TaxID=706561 RepID=A0A4U0TM33_9PEZI|nr:hypothetical protein B0A50_08394 [Salinomyces thailandica]
MTLLPRLFALYTLGTTVRALPQLPAPDVGVGVSAAANANAGVNVQQSAVSTQSSSDVRASILSLIPTVSIGIETATSLLAPPLPALSVPMAATQAFPTAAGVTPSVLSSSLSTSTLPASSIATSVEASTLSSPTNIIAPTVPTLLLETTAVGLVPSVLTSGSSALPLSALLSETAAIASLPSLSASTLTAPGVQEPPLVTSSLGTSPLKTSEPSVLPIGTPSAVPASPVPTNISSASWSSLLLASSQETSFLYITVKTTVPITDTEALATLATIPGNAGLSSLLPASTNATQSTSLATSTSALNSSMVMSTVATPAVTSTEPPLADVLQDLGETGLSTMLSVLAEVIKALAQNTATVTPASPTASLQTSASVVQAVPNAASILQTHIGSTGVASLSAVQPPANTSIALLRKPKFARQLPNPLSAIAKPSVLVASLPAVSLPAGMIPAASIPPVGTIAASTSAAPTSSSAPGLLAGLPIVGSNSTNIGLGNVVAKTIQAFAIPADSIIQPLLQGVQNASNANLAKIASNPQLSEIAPLLALLNIFGASNLELLTLTSLTSIPACQDAIKIMNEPDLIVIFDCLTDGSIIYSTAADGVVFRVVSFVQMLWKLVPLVSSIKASMAYLILSQLGLTGLQKVLDGTLVTELSGHGS